MQDVASTTYRYTTTRKLKSVLCESIVCSYVTYTPSNMSDDVFTVNAALKLADLSRGKGANTIR